MLIVVSVKNLFVIPALTKIEYIEKVVARQLVGFMIIVSHD